VTTRARKRRNIIKPLSDKSVTNTAERERIRWDMYCKTATKEESYENEQQRQNCLSITWCPMAGFGREHLPVPLQE
jgi:hypothetical protein